jgi:hypothetical protein
MNLTAETNQCYLRTPPFESPSKRIFDAVVSRTVNFYQQINRGGRLISTAPNKRLGMEILTGQPSTSEWTKDESLRQEKLCTSLAAFGVALNFISDSQMTITDDGHLIIRSPGFPEPIIIQLEEGNSHIEVAPNISFLQTLGLTAHGLLALGRSISDYYSKRINSRQKQQYKGIHENAEILETKTSFWGEEKKPEKIKIKVIDQPEQKGKWFKPNKPEKSHIETRVRFKGHYSYKEEAVKKERCRKS